jgi:manganese/zinc/iron transport system ATP- binding protein
MSEVVPLEVHDLTVAYHRKPVIWGIDFEVEQGQLIGIIGPNGAGKSTLINAIMGILPLRSGFVSIYGQKGNRNLSRIGYMPQRQSVDWDFPVTVRDVVLMGRYGKIGLFRWPGKEDRNTAEEALDKVGMLPFVNRQISQLSGGQQQRVFLARALAQQSDLYLMDEPFAGVDAATESAIVAVLRELREMGKTILVVHHDLTTAQTYFDQLMFLNMHLVAFGAVKDVWKPEILKKTYGGKLTILSGVADEIQSGEME